MRTSDRFGGMLLLFYFLIWICTSPAWAAWKKNGQTISTWHDDKQGPAVMSDGADGAFVVWTDYRLGPDGDAYIQRIDASGYPVWNESGVPLCTATGSQRDFHLVSDGSGGVIVVWQDYRAGQDIYAQRFDADGDPLWAANGVPVCTYAFSQWWIGVVSDGAGGAIVSWSDYRAGNGDVYTQRVDSDGNALWMSDGVSVCNLLSNQYGPQAVSDGSGGVIIAWYDDRSGESDIYAQRFNANGDSLWAANGVPVCTTTGVQTTPVAVADGNHGAIVAWGDDRTGQPDIFAQRIDGNGNLVWGADGLEIPDGYGPSYGPQIVRDGAGGAIIAWYESRDYPDFHVWEVDAQRVSPGGNLLWREESVRAIPTLGESDIHLASDGNLGAIVALDVYYDGAWSSDIYVQRIDAAGEVRWPVRGVPVCTAPGGQYVPVVATGSYGLSFIVAWEDERSATSNTDIYVQRLDMDGLWGNPEPAIVGCADVPGDEGGWVRVMTHASILDDPLEKDFPITGYNVWRKMAEGSAAPTPAPGILAGGAAGDVSEFAGDLDAARRALLARFADPEKVPGMKLTSEEARLLEFPEGEWESVGFHAAKYDTMYYLAAPTLGDSTGGGPAKQEFVVTAHTTTPGIFRISEIDSGYSVDNLAPAQTTGFSGAKNDSPPGVHLAWNPNGASDLSHYAIHRGTDAAFVPDGTNLLGTTTTSVYFDDTWVSSGNYHYKLLAVDRHGNVSPAALLAPGDIVATLLRQFTAARVASRIEITWTLFELGVDPQFYILRAASSNGPFERVESLAITRDHLSFVYRDETCEPGVTYTYRVDVLDEAGRRVLFETSPIDMPALPLTLFQNQPNPFNPSTHVAYYLPKRVHVTIEVFDIKGRRVMLLVNKDEERGHHAADWNATDAHGNPVASGVYFYRLTAGRETLARKMILLR